MAIYIYAVYVDCRTWNNCSFIDRFLWALFIQFTLLSWTEYLKIHVMGQVLGDWLAVLRSNSCNLLGQRRPNVCKIEWPGDWRWIDDNSQCHSEQCKCGPNITILKGSKLGGFSFFWLLLFVCMKEKKSFCFIKFDSSEFRPYLNS